MATLQVRNTLDLTTLSSFRERAREDASRMQAKVDEDCARTGKPPPDYRLLELIGKGSFGRVYKAVTTTPGPDPAGLVSASGRQQPQQAPQQQLVAVKIIDIEQSDSELSHGRADTYGDLLKEIHALRMLRATGARNINLVIEALPVGQTVWMVTEYCAGGSVATLMKPTMPGGLQERWIIPIVREVAEAVSWVHRQGIIHRDIKCANVLVTESGAVQLCDFGVSGVIETKLDKRSTVIGTPHWMAPELLLADAGAGPSPYGTEVDIWAFGAMVFEIASGHPPNVRAGLDLARLCAFLRQNAPRLEGDEFSPALRSLVAYCLQSDPARRPTIEDVQRHGYIAVPGTTERYPTSSLALLVHGYKAWEAQGGSRRSLFLAGGAQGPPPPRASSLDHHHHHHDATAAGGDGGNDGNDDDWNFSTTAAFDQNVLRTSDAQVVYDVYGSGVELELGLAAAPGEDQTPAELTARPAPIRGASTSTSAGSTAAAAAATGGKARRRPPPQLPVLKAPLEKIFDPSTMSSYSENSRVYYGRAPPPPPQQQPPAPPHPRTYATVIGSDLPLRDDSTQPGQVRESLIDLDASLHGSDLSRFVDMETIKGPRNGQNGNTAAANNHRTTTANRNTAGHHPDHHDLNHPPLSDPADTMANNNRRTQDWKFPSMAPPPASAHPEMFRFPFHGGEDGTNGPAAAAAAAAAGRSATPPIRPGIIHHPTEPVTSRPYFGDIDPRRPQPTPIPTPTGAATPVDNRASVGSLIDLDMSLDLTRPSTSHSDFGSMTGSELGSSMGPFELDRASTPAPAAVAATSSGERQPSLYISAPREPSIYVDANPREPSIYVDDSRHREPSLYAGRNREPTVYADSRREPSIYVDHNREPSIYVDSGREPSIYVDSTREPSIYVESNREPSIYVDSNREPSIYVDSDSASATREPSVHVPDNSDLARGLAELAISRRAGTGATGTGPANNASGTASGSGSFSSAYDVDAQSYTSNNTDYAADQAEYLTMSQPADLRGQAQLPQSQQLLLNQGQSGYILGQYQPRQSSASASASAALQQQQQQQHSHRRPRGGPMLPPAPAPPSQAVMQGQASPEDVREELRRMAMSLGEHLAHANAFMDSLPVKRAGGGGSSDQPDGS